MSDYHKQSAERALADAERIASHPDIADLLGTLGADIGALVATAEHAVGVALRESTHRTERLPSTRRDVNGLVPVHRTMGRGTDADHYELLDGAPVGTPETLDAAVYEARAVANDAAWARANERAERGEVVTRQTLRNAKRAAARARTRSPLVALEALNAALVGARR
jgi:hypothetical protein